MKKLLIGLLLVGAVGYGIYEYTKTNDDIPPSDPSVDPPSDPSVDPPSNPPVDPVYDPVGKGFTPPSSDPGGGHVDPWIDPNLLQDPRGIMY